MEKSLPSRERGLKHFYMEILENDRSLSLPSRERGLKLPPQWGVWVTAHVAPFAGAWIETKYLTVLHSYPRRRSLRGSVD